MFLDLDDKNFFIDYHQNDKMKGKRNRAFFLVNEPNDFFSLSQFESRVTLPQKPRNDPY